MITANAIECGNIHTVDDPYVHNRGDVVMHVTEFAMLLKFNSAEEIRQAMTDGIVEFTVFGG